MGQGMLVSLFLWLIVDAYKWRKVLSGSTENQLLELLDNISKIKGKDTIENAFQELSETENLVINEIQMTPEKTVDNGVIKEQMVNSIESPTISNKEVEPLPYDIGRPIGWKI